MATTPMGDLPINALAPTLHYADVAYLVGFVVAFVVYWVIGRSSAQRA